MPIYKGGNLNELRNYRPISVLPVLRKVFERAVFNWLSQYLEKNNLLSEEQCGFRARKSTSDAIIDHSDFVYSILDTSSMVVSLFLDFKKVLDCIDHSILLSKLGSFGIRGVAKQWFKSYLTNAQQFVSSDHVESDKSFITHGVPQGSTLDPL